ncbi:hypothetical protein FZ983_14585 [Azospirillum sp. B21]|uniref:hypothetical protein n=1 Tax=Azospirillum sp. B21 TaxID=2607496 RepID=UPI0011EDD4F6|nr:hypothetical protein [Azospirillum sp. B21]KAA0579650.1 hypothetical protein FZ983_14585 [Azospirillum sp. B21]
MVMLTEQFLIDYLLITAGLFTVASCVLGGVFLGTVYRQPNMWMRLLLWGVPATLLTTAPWSLLLPMQTALLIGAATAAAMVGGLLLMPCRNGRPARGWPGLVADGLSGIGRTMLMLAPAVVIGGAPDWVLWLSLTALVPSLYCAIVHIRNVGGLLAEESTVWGGTQGAVLAGVPALLMVL